MVEQLRESLENDGDDNGDNGNGDEDMSPLKILTALKEKDSSNNSDLTLDLFFGA